MGLRFEHKMMRYYEGRTHVPSANDSRYKKITSFYQLNGAGSILSVVVSPFVLDSSTYSFCLLHNKPGHAAVIVNIKLPHKIHLGSRNHPR